MGKSVFKDLIREIKGSLGRFISIMAITAIGAAFFAGVTASSGDMKRSSDNYYDEYNMNDIRIISSIGLTDDDLQVIAKAQGVKAVYGANSKDVLINYDDKESVAHVLSIPLNADDNDDSYINRLRIKEGRLPQNDKECVVKYESTREAVKVGDVLKFKSGTSDDINDTFKDTEYTVVGVVYSPCFVSYDLGSSDIGNGNISYCVYVGDDEFKNDYYTEAYAVVDGAKELDTYSDEYDKKVENVQNRIKNIAAGQLDNRKKDIKEEFAKAKEDKKQELLDTIRQKVTESITKQYQEYYPGYDVSSMIAPYIEPAYIKAVQEFDFDAVYAKYDGSAAAPTAGLHFTPELLKKVKEMGVEIAEVTLHVGLGTFRPVKETDVLKHHMHSEFYRIEQSEADKINHAKETGHRVIAVGTTSTRTLEAASDENGFLRETSGWTEIFIYPGYRFKVIDSLITNFHLPESTLVMLVSALAGREHVLNAYEIAVQEKYRFFSFGDAMLITDTTV
mgnify:FL=1